MYGFDSCGLVMDAAAGMITYLGEECQQIGNVSLISLYWESVNRWLLYNPILIQAALWWQRVLCMVEGPLIQRYCRWQQMQWRLSQKFWVQMLRVTVIAPVPLQITLLVAVSSTTTCSFPEHCTAWNSMTQHSTALSLSSPVGMLSSTAWLLPGLFFLAHTFCYQVLMVPTAGAQERLQLKFLLKTSSPRLLLRNMY